ncbi:MAG: hypothetical protein K0R39_2538 [Symbiobacteriaceae bacterium]|jgi:phage tail-like protein|nr:hypothetical protein [Symbiobacteriaceae bacterium]
MTGLEVAATFRLQARPAPGGGVALSWSLPDGAAPMRVRIVRRQRRYPASPAPFSPMEAGPSQLTDGDLIYDGISAAEERLLDSDGLEPGEWYYYTAFLGDPPAYSRSTQAAALATAPFGLGQKLWDLLPSAYHRNDTVLPDPNLVEPADRTRGQLRRLMAVLGGELDVIRTLAEGLRDLHDPERIPADLLPKLAATIGWDLSRFLDEEQQRREVGFAPEIFRTTGTFANLEALINLYTGWRAEVRELGRRVLTTFDRAAVERQKHAPDLYHGHLGRSLVLGAQMDPNLPVYVRNRPADDPVSYTYEMRRDDYEARYSFEAIGIWLYPNQENQALVLRKGQQLEEALKRYLPAHVRIVLFLEPPILEDSYPALERMGDELVSETVMADDGHEAFAAAGDTAYSSVPGWVQLVTNRSDRRTQAKEQRTWHSALGRWN